MLSSVNLCLTQLLDRGLGADRRIVHLFEGVGARLGTHDGKNLDVPMVIFINCLPVAEVFRWMHAAWRGVENEMKFFRERTHALQGSAQKRREIGEHTLAHEHGS